MTIKGMEEKIKAFKIAINDYVAKGILESKINCFYFAIGYFEVDNYIPIEAIKHIETLYNNGKIDS